MRIKWYGHASFLIETGGVRIITDPYDPEVVVGYAPIREPADIVIRSSDDDRGHCNAKMIPGNPTVITATEIIDGGITVRGIHFRAVPVLESVIFKESPLDNAMYCFEAEGIRITHMGDVGNPLDAEQLEALEGTDLLLALTGGPPTIDLDDLERVIQVIRPKVIIPMHYGVAKVSIKMLDVTAFTNRFPKEQIHSAGKSEIELTRESLPRMSRLVVLEPAC